MITLRAYESYRGIIYTVRKDGGVWRWNVQVGLQGEMLKSGEAPSKHQARERVREIIDLAVDVREALRAIDPHDPLERLQRDGENNDHDDRR